MQPPPRRPDSADAFFQSFDSPSSSPVGRRQSSNVQQQQQHTIGAAPSLQQRRPPAGPPPFRPPSQQQPPRPPPPANNNINHNNSSSNYLLQSSIQTHQPAGAPNPYYANASTASPSHLHYQHKQQPNQFQAPASPYGQPQPAPPPPPPKNNAANNNDWYTPPSPTQSHGSTHGAGTMAYPQQQKQTTMSTSLVPPLYPASSSTTPNTAAANNLQFNNSNKDNSSSNINMEGAMDHSGRGSMHPMAQQPSSSFAQTFDPQQLQQQMNAYPTSSPSLFQDDPIDEAPLLEELGINVAHIISKTKAVVVPFRRFQTTQSALTDPSIIVEDADLAGPIAFALLLGGELMLAGKLQFGYIYGLSLFGCLAMTLVLNLMSPSAVSFWTVTSILGYALIPVNLLAAVKPALLLVPFFSSHFGSTVVRFLAVLAVIWSTTASTRLLEIGCGLERQRFLIAYPIALLYFAFVLITIF